MEIVDKPDGIKTEKVEDEVGFMLTNNEGSFCIMENHRKSRFEGVFFRENDKVYKVIDSLKIDSPIKKMTNQLWKVDRERENTTESFFMPLYESSLLYELNEKVEFDLLLDCKQIYDNREWGRNYSILKDSNCLIIKFTKRNDKQDDNSKHNEEFDVYIALFSKDLEYRKNETWEPVFYDIDKERNSLPFERHIFNACRLRCSSIAFGFATDKKTAIKNAKYLFKNSKKLKKQKENHVSDIIHRKDIKDVETQVAYQCALNAIDSLKMGDNKIMAGLPWFFQSWARDELISLKSMINMGEYDFAKKVLFKYFSLFTPEGKLPEKDIKSDINSSDPVFWLFKRVEDLIDALEKEGLTSKYLNSKEIALIREKLMIIIAQWMKYHTKDGLIVNGPRETWMDTSFPNDTREGARVEINALFLASLRLLRKLGSPEPFEKELAKRVRDMMFTGSSLSDGALDPTARPNVFIAAYVYPELLTTKEWIKCFQKMIPKLWLSWGGLASIEKSSPLYFSSHTGENLDSYHRGDSWFWINNLAVIVLYRLDKKKFKNYIDKMMNASIKEMLYSGITGYSAEVSSALEMKSQGCLCQAWSSALFIEMIDEIYK